MRRALLVLAVLAAALALGTAQAAQVIVNFSFLNSTGNVTGKVSGHLVFEGNGSNIPAIGIYIDNSPAGGSFYPATTNLLPQFEKAGEIAINRFTLVRGVVKRAVFSGANEMDQISFGLNAPGGANFLGYGGNNFTRNEFGFVGVDYSTPAEALSVPEPASVGLLLLAIAAFWAMRKKVFFFEKKNQKTLATLQPTVERSR